MEVVSAIKGIDTLVVVCHESDGNGNRGAGCGC